MRKASQKPEPLPADLAGRIALVGATVYGKSWRRRLATGMNISRSTLFEWLRRVNNVRDVDSELIELLDSERAAASERSLQIAALRRRLMAVRSA